MLDWTSVANGALLVKPGGAVAAPWDRTPRVADLSGVEVVRRWCRLPRRSLMARFKTRHPRTRPAKQLKSNTNTQTASRSSRGTTKHDRVLGLLQAKGGTTIAAISKVTGWQPHSVRGFFAGIVKKKLGLTLASEKTRSGRIYRIVRAKTSTSAPSPSASGTAEQADA